MLTSDQNTEQKEIVLKLLLDDRIRILNELMQDEPKSAIELHKTSGIDLNVIYRIIHKLDDNNFLNTSFNITPDGKKSYLYKSKLKSINAKYHKGVFDINFSLNS